MGGKDALIYREYYSKTRQGGIADRTPKDPKVCYAFCSGYRPRCFVKLFRKYLFLGPCGNYHWPKFYVQTDPKWLPGSELWYTNCPVGKNTLAEYLQDMMSQAGIEGNFWNHSLRKACATRLFRKGVDPQLISEQMGYRSSAIIKYKKTDLSLKKQVSDMLNVLPIEMQEIHNSQERMLENENKHGGKVAKKVPPSATVSSDKTVESKENVRNVNEPKSVLDSKPQVVVDEKKGVDLHVPINTGSNFSNLQSLVQIHFHISNK